MAHSLGYERGPEATRQSKSEDRSEELGRLSSRSCRTTSSGKTMMKIAAMIVIISFLSTLPAARVSDVNRAHAAVGTSPFGQPIIVNDNKVNDQTSPVILSMPGHRLFAVWQDMRAGYGGIYASRSLDNGTTWMRNVRIDDPIFNTTRPLAPAVAMSGNGTLFVVWEDNRRNTWDYDIFLSKSYDGGATFKKNLKVDDSTTSPISWQERPSIAITLGGTLYVSWTDDRSGTLRVRGAYSTNMGVGFSASSEIAPSGKGQNEACAVANGNRIFVGFMDNLTGRSHPYCAISTNGGKSFGASTRLDGTGNPGYSQNGISMAAIPADGVIASWADTRNGNSDIYASIMSAEGKIITQDIRVENDSSYSYNWQADSTLASDQLGNIYAAWQDERTTGYPAIRFAILKSGGSLFGASVEVARPGPTDMQMLPSLAISGPGQVFVTYQDDKAGTDDIYEVVAYLPNLYTLGLSSGWNFVSMYLVNPGYKASTLGLVKGDMVVAWNSTRGIYDHTYVVGISPASADFKISASTGYWVYAVASETLTLNGTVPTAKQSRNLNVPVGGFWAAIGFESLNATRRASDIPAMYNQTGGVTAVVSYSPSTRKYSTYVVGVPSTDFKILPGHAYWCWCDQSGSLSYSP